MGAFGFREELELPPDALPDLDLDEGEMEVPEIAEGAREFDPGDEPGGEDELLAPEEAPAWHEWVKWGLVAGGAGLGIYLLRRWFTGGDSDSSGDMAMDTGDTASTQTPAASSGPAPDGGVLLPQPAAGADSLAVLYSDVGRAAFAAVLPPEAQPYADVILDSAKAANLSPFIVWSVGEGESRWGNALKPPGPGGTGDSGHGHGLMQIDDRTFGTWLDANDWTDPATNVAKGCAILMASIKAVKGSGLTGSDLLLAGLAAYNHGPGNVLKNIRNGLSPDYGTASNPPNSYGANAIQRAQALIGTYAAQLTTGTPGQDASAPDMTELLTDHPSPGIT